VNDGHDECRSRHPKLTNVNRTSLPPYYNMGEAASARWYWRMDSGNTHSKKRKSSIDGSATQLPLPFLADALNECERLRCENTALRQENALLKAEVMQLKSESPSTRTAEAKSTYQVPDSQKRRTESATDYRVKLFQSLFHSRNDVYAERWQKKDGTTNYSPAKLHQWDSHTKSERGKWQCGSGCQLLPLTDKVLEEHLKGQRTVGIYPLLKDESCLLLTSSRRTFQNGIGL
jgi:regulator of replication initiation timing